MAIALIGCNRFHAQVEHADPRVAERPLDAENDSGVAFAHEAGIVAVRLRDPSGAVTDTERANFADQATGILRQTHRVGLGPQVTVLTLPPGNYELFAVAVRDFERDPVDRQDPNDRERHSTPAALHTPALFRVDAHRVSVLGRVYCRSADDACDPELDGSPTGRELVVRTLASPRDETERAVWPSWHDAAVRALDDR
jgi:hypothetical protein